jgi:hypothetical protein
MSVGVGKVFPNHAETSFGSGRRAQAELYGIVTHNLLARVYDLATIGSVAVLHQILQARFLRAPMGFDERYFLHQGWSLAKGLVPYRDFQEFKPPMIFVVNALGLKLWGLESLAYRHAISLLSLTAFLSLTIALLSRRTNRFLAGSVVALMMHHFFFCGFHDSSINNTESVGLHFFMIGCGILLIRTRRTRLQQLAGGAVLALAPLSKEPLVFVTIAAWLTLLSLHYFDSSKRAAKRFALFTIAGAASVAGTWLVYMLATNSLSWYVVQFKLNVAYMNNYAYQMGWFPRTPADGVLAASWARLRAVYVNAAQLEVFAPLFIALLALFRGRRMIIGFLAVGTAAAALYGVTIGHGFAGHYFIMAMAGTFFCATLGLIALDQCSRLQAKAIRRWLGLSWAAIVLITVWPRFSEEWRNYGTYKPPEPPVAKSEVELVQAHTNAGDRIWNLGDPLLYVFSDRFNAVREGIIMDEMIPYYPGNTDEERLKGLRDQLLANPPKLVIFGHDPIGYQRKQRHMDAVIMPFLKESGYRQVGEKLYLRP